MKIKIRSRKICVQCKLKFTEISYKSLWYVSCSIKKIEEIFQIWIVISVILRKYRLRSYQKYQDSIDLRVRLWKNAPHILESVFFSVNSFKYQFWLHVLMTTVRADKITSQERTTRTQADTIRTSRFWYKQKKISVCQCSASNYEEYWAQITCSIQWLWHLMCASATAKNGLIFQMVKKKT